MRARRLLILFALALLPFGCAFRADPETVAVAAGTDYAAARQAFRTKLLRSGRSPEPPSAVHFSKLKRPKGVKEVEYVSGPLRLKAWTRTPAGDAEEKLPAVLFLHGGWGFDEGDWEHTRPFQKAGFVVLAPMLRGENGCPGAFTLFYDEVDDVLAAGEQLAGMPRVDPKRVYVAGYSAGGTLAMLAAMTSDRFRAAAALDGSPDRRAFIRGREGEVPFDTSDPEEFRLRSPAAFAGSFKCPTRLFCSQDPGGYLGVTRELARTALAKGRDVEMVPLLGDHATFRLPATKLAIEFFNRQ